MFPTEIWEIILGNIEDPRVLIKLQQVCKNWNNIIRRIVLKNPRLLEKVCDKLIPDFWLRPINDGWLSGVQFFTIPRQKSYLTWNEFHDAVKMPRPIMKDSSDKLLKFSPTERITCVVAHGENFIYY